MELTNKQRIALTFTKDIDLIEFEKGQVLLSRDKPDRALSLYKKILKTGEFKELWVNMGVAYKALNNLHKARECFEKAAHKDMPFSDGSFTDVYPVAISNLGLTYYALGDSDSAIKLHKIALAKDPLYYEALWNLSVATLKNLCSLKEVDHELAWKYYTYRFKRNNANKLTNNNANIIPWDFKTAYPEESIVILGEQGYGDALMFGRYIEYVKPYFKTVYVQCLPELEGIFENTCRDPIEVPAKYGIPLASLPKLLDYIPPGEWLSSKYVPKVGGELNIMCVWSGNMSHANAKGRNTHAGYFDRLPGIKHSIEPRKGYICMPIRKWTDTIKYLEKIDIVVTVDTSISHLCGALGKPCLVLMPLNDTDFRWGDDSMGSSNVWYKSVKVIRNPNNWEKVFDHVYKEILVR